MPAWARKSFWISLLVEEKYNVWKSKASQALHRSFAADIFAKSSVVLPLGFHFFKAILSINIITNV